jgi:hypothetical protein
MARALQVVAAMSMLSACLVTDEIGFPEEEQFPPTIIDVPGTEIPIGAIFWVDLEGHIQNEWSLPVRIRDDNVEQTLKARYRILREGDPLPAWTESEIAPSGVVTREDYTVTVPYGELRRKECHRVELVVSGSFLRRTDPRFFDVLNDEGESYGDIARVAWTIWEGKGERDTLDGDKVLLINSCAAIESFLQTTTTVAEETTP